MSDLRWPDRILTGLVALVMIALGVVLFFLTSGLIYPSVVYSAAMRLVDQPVSGALLGLAATGFGGWLVSLALRRPATENESIIHETDLGKVRVTRRAIETLVFRAARHVSGVRDVEAAVSQAGQALNVRLEILVLPDVNIPAVSAAVQSAVEQLLRDTAGITTSYIDVVVRNVASESRARVE